MLNIQRDHVDDPDQYDLPKVNADLTSKTRIFIQWGSFLIITLVFYLTLLAIPDALISVGDQICSQTSEGFEKFDCDESENKLYYQYPRSATIVSGIDKNNVFLMAFFDFKYHSPGRTYQRMELIYQIDVFSIDLSSNQITNQNLISANNKTHIVECNEGQVKDYLECSTMISYLSQIEHDNYLFFLQAFNNDDSLEPIQNVQINIIAASVEFTESLLGIRYTFFTASIIAFALYCYRTYRLHQWQIEQKMTFVLGALLPLFNDPFFAITIESPNRATSILGVLFVCDFVAFMSLYQLVLFSRMIYENGDKQSNAIDFKKSFICLLMWIFMMASYITIQLRFFSDPTNTYEDYTESTFMALKIIFYLISGAIFGFIVFYYVQFFRFYDSRLWRYKQLGVFSIYFIVGLQIFIYSGSFSIIQLDGGRVLLVIGILNLYVFYMLYLWSPNKKALEQMPTHQQGLNKYMKGNEQYEIVDDNFVIEEEPQEKKNEDIEIEIAAND